MRKRSLVVLAVVLVVLGVALVAMLWPSGSDPISEDEALDTFRDSSTEPEEGGGVDGAVPESGLYRYRTSGSESVKLGPLPAETRDYPDVTTATVDAAGGDCFEVNLNLLEQHTEETGWCRTDDGGLRLVSQLKNQSVAQFDTTVTMECDPGTVWSPGTDTLPLECSLALGGGPMEVTADYSGNSVSSPETVEVDGETIEVVELDMHFDLSGSVSGTWDEVLWLAPDSALLVRMERSFHLDGFAAFDEDFRLDLESMTPTR